MRRTICFLTASRAGYNGTYTWTQGSITGANLIINPAFTGICTVIGTSGLGCSSNKYL